MTGQVLLEGKHLKKTFGRFVALNDANFAIHAGEVHGLCGSNGAGKSTLIKIMTGAHRPTEGVLLMGGVEVPTGSPLAMLERGVGCIYQHSNLIPALTVLDNVFLGRPPKTKFGFIDSKSQRQQAQALLERYHIDLDLDAQVSTLATVKQKEVEILKALALDAKVILMDEPTAWLSHSEVKKLHQTISHLKSCGVGLVYISHVLDEVFQVCDATTVMRDGSIIWSGPIDEITRPELVDLMVGKELGAAASASAQQTRHPRGTGKVVLSTQNLELTNVFKDISLDLYEGEILCLTGLIGSKRTELLHSIFGSAKFTGGLLQVDGKDEQFTTPSQAIAAGIGFVPEDRLRDGLLLEHSIAENLVFAALDKVSKLGFWNNQATKAVVKRQIEELNILPADGSKIVKRLSGGNQQKVLLGKWLEINPKILFLDEPTVGVDVGAKAEIYSILRKLKEKGTAILIVSSDMEEVMTVADRVAVMVAGRLTRVSDANDITQEELVREISGGAA
ncbi:sugar ABC transporter ATP-binding protein [Cohaesibacter celericrescens]|uniref:D-xylose ABC transporter ATP-binding protein n=1 Tax=Cohaesibacter celericrescens TaxID=2067669 RepID=A0A2N5XMG9_9HYPH|nr:sugar ABC transporter ATP-binding protein [Cohaesibacter celericrescens]PLW75731.1 D-xylose ABC transporter ATP-binding protein [Cohaesibacter celericrescens]